MHGKLNSKNFCFPERDCPLQSTYDFIADKWPEKFEAHEVCGVWFFGANKEPFETEDEAIDGAVNCYENSAYAMWGKNGF